MHAVNHSRVSRVSPILSKFRALAAAGALACLAFAHVATAAPMTGSMGVVVYPIGTPSSSFTASSLTLNAQNLITTAESGDFAAQVPSLSDLTAYSTTITGLSTTPLADSISDFFVFSTPDAIFGSSGTTPNNRFDFNLATITETSFTSTSVASFSGTGTLVDTLGTFDNTPAQFNLNFSGPSNYSFTFAATAVPEPTTLGLVATGLVGALSFRRRRVAR
jgi:PEP-CTERM motif